MALVEHESRSSGPLNPDAHFDLLFYGDDYQYLIKPIPKIAHFVYTDIEPLNWINYLAVKGAIVNLGVQKVKIWIPHGQEREGEIWQKVAKLPEVELLPTEIPNSVYGVKIEDAVGKSDVLRLKVLYQEGGIFLENDLIPLKPIDFIFDDPNTRSTVMAERMAPEGVPNWLIISKPRSPFLRRWMEEYAGEKDWNALAIQKPLDLLKKHDPHLQVMSGKTWFYPLASDMDGDASLKKLWFGKSWFDIDESYGTHVWHWKDDFRSLLSPSIIREVDTPLFCRLRPLLKDLDDGQKSKPFDQDPNCAVVPATTLDPNKSGLFADYAISGDHSPIKLLDSSGHNLHGWAPNGTALTRSRFSNVRAFGPGDYAVLPVPLNWDARVFTLQMTMRIDPECLHSENSTVVVKIRMDKEEELLVQFKSVTSTSSAPTWGSPSSLLSANKQRRGVSETDPHDVSTAASVVALDLHWESTLKDKFHEQETLSWISPPLSPPSSSASYLSSHSLARASPLVEHLSTLTLSFDRRHEGRLVLFLDNDIIGENELPLIHSPRMAQDVWLNSRNWDVLDAGFRGELSRLTLWADAIAKENISVNMAENPSFTGGLDFRPAAEMSYYPGQEGLLSVMILIILLIIAAKFWGRIRRDMSEVIRACKDMVSQGTSGYSRVPKTPRRNGSI